MALHVIHFEHNGATYRLGVDTDKLGFMAAASVKNKSRRAVEAGGAFTVTPSSSAAHAAWLAKHASQ